MNAMRRFDGPGAQDLRRRVEKIGYACDAAAERMQDSEHNEAALQVTLANSDAWIKEFIAGTCPAIDFPAGRLVQPRQ